MNQTTTCVILTKYLRNEDTENRIRLIETADPLSDEWIYSLFVTTIRNQETAEEFVYDVARSKEDAFEILRRLCEQSVTAYHLHEAVYHIISESVTLL